MPIRRWGGTPLTIIACILGGAALATAWFLAAGPSNYDDCILQNMRGVGDRFAAHYVEESCARRFGQPAAPRR
ncbi:MAG: hypothetical protein K2X46_06895 [Roseomonas sp.]|nr:hypothetical protein [Roseomonas sp.]